MSESRPWTDEIDSCLLLLLAGFGLMMLVRSPGGVRLRTGQRLVSAGDQLDQLSEADQEEEP